MEGSRRGKENREKGLLTPDLHVDGGNGVKTIVYNTKEDKKKEKRKRKEKRKEREKESKRLKKYNSKKKKNSLLLVPVLGHVRGYFLYLCACNSFLLTLYTNIFILDSD